MELSCKLTAYNRDVQRFLMGGRANTIRKVTILEMIEQAVIKAGKSFERLFPAKSKRQAVLDEVIYYLSGTGICKVSAATLAEKTGASIRTVSAAVKNMKETGEIIVAGLADGKNKYVFVLKSHPNFERIMKEVFFLDDAEQNAGQIAEQENSKTVETVRTKGQNSSSNHNSFINTKQEKDIIQQSIENDIKVHKNNSVKTREKLKSYGANTYQISLFDKIMAFPFPQEIKDVAGIIALRVGMDCNEQLIVKSLQILTKIALNIRTGVTIDSIPAVFAAEIKNKFQSF